MMEFMCGGIIEAGILRRIGTLTLTASAWTKLLLCFAVSSGVITSASALRVGFSEVDFQAGEDNGGRLITVVKMQENVGELMVTVVPLTFAQFTAMGMTLPSHLQNTTINAAEFDHLKQDFGNGTLDVLFPPSRADMEMDVMIRYIDDDINEPEEGFLVVTEITTTHPQDENNLVLIRNGVALMIIEDNDAISLGFEKAAYTVQENAGTLDNFVFVIKENEKQTEQVLNILLHEGASIADAAEKGVDFGIAATPIAFTFQPLDQRMAVVFNISDDGIPEDVESFYLLLSVPEGTPEFLIGRGNTKIDIEDNELVVIGFQELVYTANEGDGFIQVCVVLLEPDDLPSNYFASGVLITAPGSAESDVDYTPIQISNPEFVDLTQGMLEMCYEIIITDDNVADPEERFTVQLMRDPGFTLANIILSPNESVIEIQDNDVVHLNLLPHVLWGTNGGNVAHNIAETAVIQLYCEGSAPSAPDIAWTRDGMELMNDPPHLHIRTSLKTPTTSSSVLTIDNFGLADDGVYVCVGSSETGLRRSGTLTLTALGSAPSRLLFFRQPISREQNPNNDATRYDALADNRTAIFYSITEVDPTNTDVRDKLFRCDCGHMDSAAGFAAPNVVWVRDGVQLVHDGTKITINTVLGGNPGRRVSDLQILDFQDSDSGVIQCIYTDADSDAEIFSSIPHRLDKGDTLVLKRITPYVIVINPPEKLFLEVESSGAYARFGWSRNGVRFSTAEAAVFQATPERFIHYYEIYVRDPTTISEDLGIYHVELVSGHPFQDIRQAPDIEFAVVPFVEPSTSTNQTMFTTAEGGSVSVLCTSTGNPTPSIIWRFGGNLTRFDQTDPPPTNPRGSVISGNRFEYTEGQAKSTLHITNVVYPHDNGVYDCFGVNSHGGMERSTTATFTLEVQAAPLVKILSIPRTRISLGKAITLICTVTKGNPMQYTYVWSFTTTGMTLAETSDTLTLSNIMTSEFGTYRCDATNDAGVGSANVTIEQGGITMTLDDFEYTAIEGEDIQVQISKQDENYDPVVMMVTPLTYGQFESMGYTFPDEFDNVSLPNPAESEPSGGKQDFTIGGQNVTFMPSNTFQTLIISISLSEDIIHEPEEGFLLLLEMVYALSDTVVIDRNVSLARITDDDGISLRFEHSAYTVQEDAGDLGNTVSIIKENGMVSERTLAVLLRANNGTSHRSARQGEDFQGGEVNIELLFPPEAQMIQATGISIIDSPEPELLEEFTLLISAVSNASYSLGTTTAMISIVDNDFVIIGFEHTLYNVEEGDGGVEVCVIFSEPQVQLSPNFIASGNLSSFPNTATVNEDYSAIEEVVNLDESNRRMCFNITVTDDIRDEPLESFIVELKRIPSLTAHTVRFSPNVSVIEIQDDDCTDGEIRLAGGGTELQGRVEICYGNIWGTVCDNGWEYVDAVVVCRQLGHSAVSAMCCSSFGQGSGPIFLDRIACNGAESYLSNCSNPGVGIVYGCSHSHSAGVVCAESINCTDGEIRLVGGATELEGRVEICHGGIWGTVCDDGWGYADAQVVCGQLGLSTLSESCCASFGQGTGPILLNRVACSGTESHLSNCSHQGVPSRYTCSHYKDAGVVCAEPLNCTDGDIRLVGGATELEGRVEICYGGIWGTVCDDDWDYEDAVVVCRQFRLSAVSESCCASFGQGTGPILLNRVACSGTESHLSNCSHRGVPSRYTCGHYEDAGVVCAEPLNCTDGDIRLVGGATELEGRVEICYGGIWGTVCDDGWDYEDAVVVCRQFRLSAVSERCCASFGQGTGPILLNRVACSGTESHLSNCSHQGVPSRYTCSHYEDAGVVCAAPLNCIDGEIRLVGGASELQGRVEICFGAVWGTVCDESWGYLDAMVVCRQLGLSAVASTRCCSSFGEGNGTIFLYGVACSGTESYLSSCRHPGFGNVLSSCRHHSRDAGVVCAEPLNCTDGDVRLAGGATQLEGRVEFCYEGIWGTVCHYSWGYVDALVVCRQLGLSAVSESCCASFGQGTGPILLDYVGCSGTESTLSDCSHAGIGNVYSCRHSQDAGVVCAEPLNCTDGDVRLAGGATELEGRVEFCYEGIWGTVCHYSWGYIDALVVCRQLGLSAVSESCCASFGQGTGPILLDYIGCTGTESTLSDCSHAGIGNVYSCRHSQDAGVVCAEPLNCTDGEIRLVGGVTKLEGRVEICYGGVWGTVCDNGWGYADAMVVCRQLELSAVSERCCSSFGQGSGPTLLQHVGCSGTESNLLSCSHGGIANVYSCSHSEDAEVVCAEPLNCTDGDVRLVGGATEQEGRVEFCYGGVWGTVCDDGWGYVDAMVVCRQLGLSAVSERCCSSFGQGSGPTLLQHVGCSGTESNLLSCSHGGIANVYSCSHSEDAGVVCAEPINCTDGEIRLAGGVTELEGRVEICYGGIWGTVCDNGWGYADAQVVCGQLGLLTVSERCCSSFGEGSGPILLDNVRCRGTESNLLSCSHQGIGTLYSCSHSEDAGVVCVT